MSFCRRIYGATQGDPSTEKFGTLVSQEETQKLADLTVLLLSSKLLKITKSLVWNCSRAHGAIINIRLPPGQRLILSFYCDGGEIIYMLWLVSRRCSVINADYLLRVMGI